MTSFNGNFFSWFVYHILKVLTSVTLIIYRIKICFVFSQDIFIGLFLDWRRFRRYNLFLSLKKLGVRKMAFFIRKKNGTLIGLFFCIFKISLDIIDEQIYTWTRLQRQVICLSTQNFYVVNTKPLRSWYNSTTHNKD